VRSADIDLTNGASAALGIGGGPSSARTRFGIARNAETARAANRRFIHGKCRAASRHTYRLGEAAELASGDGLGDADGPGAAEASELAAGAAAADAVTAGLLISGDGDGDGFGGNVGRPCGNGCGRIGAGV
jgi:hypothetical protein